MFSYKTMLLFLGILGLTVTSSTLHAQRLRISQKWSTTGDPRVVEFGYINGMAEAGDGTIWLSDNMNRLLVTLDATGQRVRIVARKGDGPGEVRAPAQIAPMQSGDIAVYDLVHNSAEIFGHDSRFIRRVRFEDKVMNPKGFAVLPSGSFIISGGSVGGTHAIYHFSTDGRLRGSWHRFPETSDPRAGMMVAGGPVSIMRNGSLIFSQAAPHQIVVYSASGGRSRVLASDKRLVEPMGDNFFLRQKRRDGELVRTPQWFFPQSRGVFELPNGNILNVVWFLEEGRSLWQLYSRTGKLITQSNVGRAYEPWMLTRNGDILASYRDPATGEHVATRLSLQIH